MLDGCQVLIESQASCIEMIEESLHLLLLLPYMTSLWPSSSSRPEVLNFGFAMVTASSLCMHSIHTKMLNWVRLADDFLHPGVPLLNMVAGSGPRIVSVNRWKVFIDPGGREVVNQLINSCDVQGTLLDGKHRLSWGIRKWTKCP